MDSWFSVLGWVGNIGLMNMKMSLYQDLFQKSQGFNILWVWQMKVP